MEWLVENASLFWLIVAVLFMIMEAATAALLTIWFVGGALIAMLIAMVGLGFGFQIAGFIIVSALLMMLVRPYIRRTRSQTTKTNADSLVGKRGIVTQESTEFTTGQGKVGGQIWTITHLNKKPMAMDERFVVIGIDGVKLIVNHLVEDDPNAVIM